MAGDLNVQKVQAGIADSAENVQQETVTKNTTSTTVPVGGEQTIAEVDANLDGFESTVNEKNCPIIGPQVKPGEVGSKEYLSNLLGIDFSQDGIDIKCDEQGRVIYIAMKSIWDEYQANGWHKSKQTYHLSYDNKGNVTVTYNNGSGMVGMTDGSKTYNKDYELVKEVLPHAVTPDAPTTTINYKHGRKTSEVEEYPNPKDGIAKKVTSYDRWGNVKNVKYYDEKGNRVYPKKPKFPPLPPFPWPWFLNGKDKNIAEQTQ